MTNNISIINTTDNDLHLEVKVDGVDVGDMEVRFVVEIGEVCHVYKCKQGSEAARWDVHIPSPSYIPMGEYPFHVEIVTNGYFFAPYSGTINVSTKPEVGGITTTEVKTKPTTDLLARKKRKLDVVLEQTKTKKPSPKTKTKLKPSKPITPTKAKIGTDNKDDVVKMIIDGTNIANKKPGKLKIKPTVRPLQLPTKSKTKPKLKITPKREHPKPTIIETPKTSSRLDQVFEEFGEPDAQAELVRTILGDTTK